MTSAQIHARNLKIPQKQQDIQDGLYKIKFNNGPVKVKAYTRNLSNRKHVRRIKFPAITYAVLSTMVFMGVYTYAIYGTMKHFEVEASAPLLNPQSVMITPTPKVEYITVETLVEAKTEKQQILAYLVKVFGDHSGDAIAMLNNCENHNFDQNATNVNRNGTTDYGVMQINSIHIPKCGEAIKSDYKANIDCGYKIWKESNNSFYQWSCAGEINQASYKESL